MGRVLSRILISGYGDIGARVANWWRQRTSPNALAIHALCRSERPQNPAQVTFIHGDLDYALNADLPDFDAVYHFMPPPNSGTSDSRVAHLLAALTNAPKKMLLISTSAVYGDCHGDWVDEQSPVQPSSDRGRRRADAEAQWQQWAKARACDWVILRVPGIYGPGRLPLARLEKGVPMVIESAAPHTNRIHSEDLAAIAGLAIAEDSMHGIYNVSDGQPGNMTQYFNAVADAAGLPRPPLITMAEAQQQLSAGMLSYLVESRRLRNDKLLRDSGYQFIYPDLASGLAASLPTVVPNNVKR